MQASATLITIPGIQEAASQHKRKRESDGKCGAINVNHSVSLNPYFIYPPSHSGGDAAEEPQQLEVINVEQKSPSTLQESEKSFPSHVADEVITKLTLVQETLERLVRESSQTHKNHSKLSGRIPKKENYQF